VIDTIVHSFTVRLGRADNIHKAASLYRKTAKSARRFYRAVLYTDTESAALFEGAYDETRIIDTSGFFMLDDMKVHTLPHLAANELLTDGDVMIRRPLSLAQGCDAVCDVGVPPDRSIPCMSTLDLFLGMGITDHIPFYLPGLPVVPNIGILHFNCEDSMREYVRWYGVLRDWVSRNGLVEVGERSRGRLSVMTTPQYLLGSYMRSAGKTICYARAGNDYSHYMLDEKYRDGFEPRW
jgi:hypothetical protein